MTRRTIAVTLALPGLLLAAGCNLGKTGIRKDADVQPASATVTQPGIGPAKPGTLITPKQTDLEMALLVRPQGDKVLNEGIWRACDEQVISLDTQRALQANGLRLGLITGRLPAEVDEILHAPPPNQIDKVYVHLFEGGHTVFRLRPKVEQTTLLLNRQGKTAGKDYKDASGMMRITANQTGAWGVSLRFAPEIHHGPVQQGYSAVQGAGPFAPQEFMLKNGQQEETLRDLAATLDIQPGQIAVIGFRGDSSSSLGSFLFSEVEANSDRAVQKVLLVWAARNNMGSNGDGGEARAVRPSERSLEGPALARATSKPEPKADAKARDEKAKGETKPPEPIKPAADAKPAVDTSGPPPIPSLDKPAG